MNRLEFERLALPVSSLVLLAVSFLCFVVAIGTPGWVQVVTVYNASLCMQHILRLLVQLDVYMENDFRGTVTFGLIQGMESLTGNVVAELSESYVICKQVFPPSSIIFTFNIIQLTGLAKLSHSFLST